MSAYETLDKIRDITNCPNGKSITQHVAALRAQVEELEGIKSKIARLNLCDYDYDAVKFAAAVRAALAEWRG